MTEPISELTRPQRDFLLLSIYFYLQHGFPKRAAVLAECLMRMDSDSNETLLAYAVSTFTQARWKAALRTVKALEKRIAAQDQTTIWLLSYLKMRCLLAHRYQPPTSTDGLMNGETSDH